MEIDRSPTKGNLMQIEKTLELSRSGHSLMDRKRLILMNEIVSLVEKAKQVQDDLTAAYENAYAQMALAEEAVGLFNLQEIAEGIEVEDQINIKVRSIMGSEIPEIDYTEQKADKLPYSLTETSIEVDRTRLAFEEVKKLQIKLAEIENTAYRLANNIQKTQKRVNALQNVTIPQLESAQRDINNELEEKEREEFTRMKAVKRVLSEKELIENQRMKEYDQG
jgi:V/A-type H+-transporting ATPase subunit D